MSGKYALVIANTDYGDPALAQLTAPGRDAEDFARVLRDKEIGAFDDVKVLLNSSEPEAREAIDEFFDQKKSDDLLVLYFSGSLGIAVIPPTYGGVSRQNALFAPKCSKITAIPREPFFRSWRAR